MMGAPGMYWTFEQTERRRRGVAFAVGVGVGFALGVVCWLAGVAAC